MRKLNKFGIVTLLWVVSAVSHATQLIPFQARLTDAIGDPVADGVYAVNFVIYDTATGGIPLWSETHASVSVIGGVVNVILGGLVPLSDPDNNGDPSDAVTFYEMGGDRFIGITVDTGQEMVPRHQVVPSFHARAADTVSNDAIDSTKILDGSILTEDLADASVTTDKLATGSIGAVALQDGAVSNIDLADSAVSESKIAVDSISTVKILDGAVTSSKISSDAITTANVIDDAITEDKLSDSFLSKIDSLNLNFYGAWVDCDPTPTHPIEIGGDWISTIIHSATGKCRVNLNAGYCASDIAVVVCSPREGDGSGSTRKSACLYNISSRRIDLIHESSGGGFTDGPSHVFLMCAD